MSSTRTYKTVCIDSALKEYAGEKGYTHAAHAALYAATDQALVGKYPFRYYVSMQMRFDGTLGFAGGMVDPGETPEDAVNRELSEEFGCRVEDFGVTREAHHLLTQVSEQTHLCLHFYGKQVSLEQLQTFEQNALKGHDYGTEVLGLVRVPLYTLPNGLGFPAFLNNQFIGNSKHQLLTVLRERGLMEERQLEDAIHTSSTVNTVVTAEEVNY